MRCSASTLDTYPILVAPEYGTHSSQAFCKVKFALYSHDSSNFAESLSGTSTQPEPPLLGALPLDIFSAMTAQLMDVVITREGPEGTFSNRTV